MTSGKSDQTGEAVKQAGRKHPMLLAAFFGMLAVFFVVKIGEAGYQFGKDIALAENAAQAK